jgi:hypothetical protein
LRPRSFAGARGKWGNLVRGLEAPLSGPEGWLPASDCYTGSGPPRRNDVSERPRPQPPRPPAPAHERPGQRTGSMRARQRPAQQWHAKPHHKTTIGVPQPGQAHDSHGGLHLHKDRPVSLPRSYEDHPHIMQMRMFIQARCQIRRFGQVRPQGPRLQRPPAATAVENQANASVTVPFGDGAVGHRVDDRAGRGDRRACPSGMTPDGQRPAGGRDEGRVRARTRRGSGQPADHARAAAPGAPPLTRDFTIQAAYGLLYVVPGWRLDHLGGTSGKPWCLHLCHLWAAVLYTAMMPLGVGPGSRMGTCQRQGRGGVNVERASGS